MIFGAGSRSNSTFSSASSSSWSWGTGRAGGSTRKLIGPSPTSSARSTRPTRPTRPTRSHARAFADTDLGLVGTGLVVVDVELGPVVGRGELVQVLEPGGDRLGATRTVHPLPEGFAGRAFVGESPHDPHGGLGRPLRRQ